MQKPQSGFEPPTPPLPWVYSTDWATVACVGIFMVLVGNFKQNVGKVFDKKKRPVYPRPVSSLNFISRILDSKSDSNFFGIFVVFKTYCSSRSLIKFVFYPKILLLWWCRMYSRSVLLHMYDKQSNTSNK